MSPSPAVRVLLVGAGNRGRVWARVCAETPGVELAGVLDTAPSRAEALGATLGTDIPVYRDLAEALDDGAPAAVVVVTPPATHHHLVGAALSAGAHVLCEKPLSEDFAEAVDLVRQAEARGLRLMVGMNFRYLETSQRIRRYVRDGTLGALSHAHFVYLRHRDGHRADLNDYPLKMAYPMLHEQSVHHFDLLRYCYDSEVESLVADSWRPPWSTYEGDCCVSVAFRFENGAHVNYLGTWTAAWNRMVFSWRSDFASGALLQESQFDDLMRVDFRPELARSGPRFRTAVDAEPVQREDLEPCVPFIDDTRRLLTEFVNAITRGIEPTTTGADHLRTLGLVRACIESAETKRWVELSTLHGQLDLPSRATT